MMREARTGPTARAAMKSAFVGGNILLGGGGSDFIEGRGGDDVIDGDAWLNVRIRFESGGRGLYRRQHGRQRSSARMTIWPPKPIPKGWPRSSAGARSTR